MAIHIRHGNKVNLPTSAPESQPLFVDDTQEMYMGVGTSPPVPIKINASNIIGGGGGGTTVSVNGTPVTNPNFNDSTPAAPAGKVNATWQSDVPGNVSACVPLADPVGSAATAQSNAESYTDGKVPHTIAPVASEWLTGYDASTETFSRSRPAYADITSPPQLAQTKTGVASSWLNSYDAATGVFGTAQPAFTDLLSHPTTLSGYGITDALSSSTVLPITDAGSPHHFLTSYSATTGLFTDAQPDYSIVNRVSKVGSYTTTASDFALVFTTVTSPPTLIATVTLDSGAAVQGTTYRIKLSAAAVAGSNLVVAPNNGKTIDNQASMTMTVLGDSIDVTYDGSTNWDIF